MRALAYTILLLFCLISCNRGDKAELSPEEKLVQDSLAKVVQKLRVDSMKKKNPLLIVPPDSNYSGSYVDKYSNGIVKFKGYFRLGLRHGQWFSFYPNGLMWSEMHFDKGLRHGLNTTYFENGRIRYSGFYKNDLRDSTWNYYDSTGKLAQKVLFSKDRILKQWGNSGPTAR